MTAGGSAGSPRLGVTANGAPASGTPTSPGARTSPTGTPTSGTPTATGTPASATPTAPGAPVPLTLPQGSRGALTGGAALILAGLLVPVAFGRWGSHIGIPGTPIYMSDLLVVGGLALLGLHRVVNGPDRSIRRAPRPVVVASILWGVLVLLGLLRADGPMLLVLRDALPYLYLALAPVIVRVVRTLGTDVVLTWLMRAAVVHTFWYAAAVLGVLPTVRVGFVGVDVFDARGDFDGLVSGIAIVSVLLVAKVPLGWRLMVAGLSGAAVLAQGSRAGLVSAMVVVVVAILASRPFRDERAGPVRLAAVFIAIPLLGAALRAAATADGWARGLERLVAGAVSSDGGSNTTTARIDAWGLVIDHVAAKPSTWWLGEGFGSSYVADSGAIVYLSGDHSVRQPHSILVGWFATGGMVGLAIALAAVTVLTVGALRRLRRGRAETIAAAVQVGVLFSAAVGVILESPFGYMLYVLAVALTYADDAPAGSGDEPGRLQAPLAAPPQPPALAQPAASTEPSASARLPGPAHPSVSAHPPEEAP